MESAQISAIPPVVSSPLFLLDYDGTLAEIQDTPMQAFPYDGAKSVLIALNQHYPVWVVTGRHLRDLKTLLDVEVNAIGLHGLQKGTLGGKYRVSLPESTFNDMRWMQSRLPELKGIRLEDKEYTFSVHYRGAPDEEALVRALLNWLKPMPGSLTAIWGKKVVELKPAGVSKGHAVTNLANKWPDHTPIYIGDDTTDEDAFKALHKLTDRESLTIKVGEGKTNAKYRLPGVSDVVSYLKRYLAD